MFSLFANILRVECNSVTTNERHHFFGVSLVGDTLFLFYGGEKHMELENTSQNCNFCKNCGSETSPTDKFCMHCGIPLYQDAQTEQLNTLHNPRKIKKWPFFVGGGILIFIIIVVIFSSVCFHQWQPATCTSAKTCTNCGKTEGEPLGHARGEVEAYTNYISAKLVTTTSCKICEAELDRYEIDMSKFHDGNVFTFTPSNFSLRFDAMLDEINNCTLNAECISRGNAIICNIEDSGNDIGYVGFFSNDQVFTPSQKYDDNIDSVFLSTDGASALEFAEMAVSLIQTCDPSLSFEEAKDIASESFTIKNGLSYLVVIENGVGNIMVTIE